MRTQVDSQVVVDGGERSTTWNKSAAATTTVKTQLIRTKPQGSEGEDDETTLTIGAESALKHSTPSEKRQVLSQIYYTVLVVTLCLTAFNLYLFAWILFSLSGGSSSSSSLGNTSGSSSSSSSSRLELNLPASGGFLDLLGSSKRWRSVELSERLVVSAKWLQTTRIAPVARDAPIEITSGRAVVVGDSSCRPTSHDCANVCSHDDCFCRDHLLELDALSAHLRFPCGLRVVGASGRKLLTCSGRRDSRGHAHAVDVSSSSSSSSSSSLLSDRCLVETPNVRLSHPRGVDASNRSLHAHLVETSRIHSPTNSLNLLSTSSRLVSSRGSMRLQAIEGIVFMSRNSQVVLSAKLVNISGVVSPVARAERKSNSSGFKLCVCARARGRDSRDHRAESEQVGEPSGIRRWPSGRVFAVESRLDCDRFSRAVCRLQSASVGRLTK